MMRSQDTTVFVQDVEVIQIELDCIVPRPVVRNRIDRSREHFV